MLQKSHKLEVYATKVYATKVYATEESQTGSLCYKRATG